MLDSMIFEIRSKFSAAKAFCVHVQYECRSRNPRKSEKVYTYMYDLQCCFYCGSIWKVFHVLLLNFLSHSAIGTTIWLWHHFKISDESQNVMEVCFEKRSMDPACTYAWNPVSIRNVAKTKLHPIPLSILLNPSSVMNVTDKISIHCITP